MGNSPKLASSFVCFVCLDLIVAGIRGEMYYHASEHRHAETLVKGVKMCCWLADVTMFQCWLWVLV